LTINFWERENVNTRIYVSRGAPATSSYCADPAYLGYLSSWRRCRNSNCTYSVPICAIYGTGALFVSIDVGTPYLDASNDTFQVTASNTVTTLAINQSPGSYSLNGQQIQLFNYNYNNNNNNIVDIISTTGSGINLYFADFVSGGCGYVSTVTQVVLYCGTLITTTNPTVQIQAIGSNAIDVPNPFTIGTASYGNNSAFAYVLTTSAPITINLTTTFYVSFSLNAGQGFKLSVSTSGVPYSGFLVDIQRRFDCASAGYTYITSGVTGIGSGVLTVYLAPNLAPDGDYVAYLRNYGPGPVPITLSLSTGSSACINISGAISYCTQDNHNKTLVDTINSLYGFQNLLYATNLDVKAANDYIGFTSTLISPSDACLNALKRFLCGNAFPTCDSNGVETPSCSASCSSISSVCGGNQQCFVNNCAATTPCSGHSLIASLIGLLLVTGLLLLF